MPEIQTVGETSLIFFNKKFTQSIKPVPGDFRIQVQFGGIYRLVHPDAESLKHKIVDTFPGKIPTREWNCYKQ
jgi:hypothetical protein